MTQKHIKNIPKYIIFLQQQNIMSSLTEPLQLQTLNLKIIVLWPIGYVLVRVRASKVVDKVAPLVQFVNSYIRQRPPISIKNKMNTRKRFLKAQKVHPSDDRRDKIKIISYTSMLKCFINFTTRLSLISSG